MREWVRLLVVVLPASIAIGAVAAVVAIALTPSGAGENGTRGAPRVGLDHWHATYRIFICGERRPNLPLWEAGVHTHGDGVIHTHPFVPSEEGEGARLVKFFEYGGGKLTQSEMRMPGDRHTYTNGDKCPDGSEAAFQVLVNGEALSSWSGYIPQDGDHIDIVFGPLEGSYSERWAPPEARPTPPGPPTPLGPPPEGG